MAIKDKDTGKNNPGLAESAPAVQSQAQTTSAEPEHKADNAPEKSDETVFFDTTIAKVKKIDGEDVVVMSDHLDPGEKLKTVYDEEKTAAKLKKRADATTEQAKK